MACGILVPRPEMGPWPHVVEARSPTHWTAKEFPSLCQLLMFSFSQIFYFGQNYMREYKALKANIASRI